MSDEVKIASGRGAYRLRLAGAPELSGQALLLPLVMEHQDGLERVGLICRVTAAGAGLPDHNSLLSAFQERDSRALCEFLRPIAARLEQNFEQLREAALKSLRTERRPLQINLDEP
jgi:hypothetical protein